LRQVFWFYSRLTWSHDVTRLKEGKRKLMYAKAFVWILIGVTVHGVSLYHSMLL
jgi:hypothetical protein